jgi:hypothetical protein
MPYEEKRDNETGNLKWYRFFLGKSIDETLICLLQQNIVSSNWLISFYC